MGWADIGRDTGVMGMYFPVQCATQSIPDQCAVTVNVAGPACPAQGLIGDGDRKQVPLRVPLLTSLPTTTLII